MVHSRFDAYGAYLVPQRVSLWAHTYMFMQLLKRFLRNTAGVRTYGHEAPTYLKNNLFLDRTILDRSALDSPFRTRKPPNLGTRGPQSTADRPPSGSPFSGPPATSSSPAAAEIASATSAAACLPWQGARVCIVELAPSLTFLGAVRAVEAEARRVGQENDLTLRDQNLLICSDQVVYQRSRGRGKYFEAAMQLAGPDAYA